MRCRISPARIPWRGLPLGLLLLLLGCGGGSQYQTAEVSGKVLQKDGKPLPGGVVTFVAKEGAVTASGEIAEDGQYKVNAPLGDVRISVNNRMLKKEPPKGPILKRPDDTEGVKTLPGKYVSIPDKYLNPDQSGLTYKVVPGPQTHDIKLE
jgi:hypothetical protein